MMVFLSVVYIRVFSLEGNPIYISSRHKNQNLKSSIEPRLKKNKFIFFFHTTSESLNHHP